MFPNIHNEDLWNMIKDVGKKESDFRNKHIEEFAAAFLKHTGLPPDHCTMNIKTKYTNDGIVEEIWFTPRY